MISVEFTYVQKHTVYRSILSIALQCPLRYNELKSLKLRIYNLQEGF